MRNLPRIFLFFPVILFWVLGCVNTWVFNVKDYGALGNGVTTDTDAINSTIEACVNAGGGTVLFPSGGVYLSGTIHLGSSITYVLEKGASIHAAPAGMQAYDSPEHNPWSDYQDFGHIYFKNSFIYGDNLKDIKFIGEGIIDGSNMSRKKVASGDGNKTFAIKQSENIYHFR